MQIAPALHSSPAFPTFSVDISNAIRSTRSALENLNTPKGAMPIINPLVPALANLKNADMWLNDAVIHPGTDTSAAAVKLASAAHDQIQAGINLLTHRLNGPVNMTLLKADVSAALQLLQSASAK